MQTLLASKALRPPLPALVHERLELDDGDFLDLAHGIVDGPPRAVVCLYHGLAGGLGSAYARGAVAALARRGLQPQLMLWRGCSGIPNRLARSYHSGCTDDIERTVRLARQRHSGLPVLAVGFSLGANALLKYLGESGDDCPLDAAFAVSPPLVLAVGAAKLDVGAARGYRGHLLGNMRAQHEAKRTAHPGLALRAATSALDSFRKFDDALTAPLHGFAGVDDYYERCSARRYLRAIRRPTRILCAADDPFFTPAILPDEAEARARHGAGGVHPRRTRRVHRAAGRRRRARPRGARQALAGPARGRGVRRVRRGARPLSGADLPESRPSPPRAPPSPPPSAARTQPTNPARRRPASSTIEKSPPSRSLASSVHSHAMARAAHSGATCAEGSSRLTGLMPEPRMATCMSVATVPGLSPTQRMPDAAYSRCVHRVRASTAALVAQ